MSMAPVLSLETAVEFDQTVMAPHETFWRTLASLKGSGRRQGAFPTHLRAVLQALKHLEVCAPTALRSVKRSRPVGDHREKTL
jgi:hypothetical protein